MFGANLVGVQVARLERNVEDVDVGRGLECACLTRQPNGVLASVAIAVSLCVKCIVKNGGSVNNCEIIAKIYLCTLGMLRTVLRSV